MPSRSLSGISPRSLSGKLEEPFDSRYAELVCRRLGYALAQKRESSVPRGHLPALGMQVPDQLPNLHFTHGDFLLRRVTPL